MGLAASVKELIVKARERRAAVEKDLALNRGDGVQAFTRAAAAAGGPTEGMFTVDCTRLQNVTILQLLSCASESAQTSQ
jgi:hypothetical protein